MNALRDDLCSFSHAITRGDALAHGINPAYQKYTSTDAIEVYRNNYRGNLHDALAAAYPVIEQLVGKAFFRRLTREYIEQHPSRSGNLHRYGDHMAAFIGTYLPAKKLVYLPDMAALEWACHSAYFAADAGTLELGKLSRLEQAQYPDVVLVPHPACHMVRSRYPIAAIWHAHQPGAPDDFHIDLESGSCNALVIRNADIVVVSELAASEAVWLSRILEGDTFGDATAVTLERYPDFDLQAGLAGLVAQGVFVDCFVKGLP